MARREREREGQSSPQETHAHTQEPQSAGQRLNQVRQRQATRDRQTTKRGGGGSRKGALWPRARSVKNATDNVQSAKLILQSVALQLQQCQRRVRNSPKSQSEAVRCLQHVVCVSLCAGGRARSHSCCNKLIVKSIIRHVVTHAVRHFGNCMWRCD